jgi:hypothetical protein
MEKTKIQSKLFFWKIVIKSAVTHTVTYFFVGLLSYSILEYSTSYANTTLKLLMRQTTEPLVLAGPLFQPIRGILFGIVFFLLKDIIFQKKSGWLVLWASLFVIGIVSTFGPSPGSLEGLIYTVLPISIHLKSLPEAILQSFALSIIVVYWVNHEEKKWLNWTMGIAFFFALSLPLLGLLARQI